MRPNFPMRDGGFRSRQQNQALRSSDKARIRCAGAPPRGLKTQNHDGEEMSAPCPDFGLCRARRFSYLHRCNPGESLPSTWSVDESSRRDHAERGGGALERVVM